MPLHAELHGPESAPAGRRVVLVHGFTQTRRAWDPILPRLDDGTRRIVAVDAPGHGRSAGHRVDLVEGARLLGESGGEASYIGYSMGGRLVLQLAVADPRLVRRVVLVGATAGIDDAGERSARRLADENLAHHLEVVGLDAFLEGWLDNPLFATLPREAAGLDERRENGVAGLAAALRQMGTGTQEPLWDRLGALSMPALFVTGSLDEKFTALAHRLVASWGGPARVAVMARAGHACHLERPQEFADLLNEFLDEDDPQWTDRPRASSSP